MATPVGHVLAGCAAGSAATPGRERVDGALLAACGALAVAPDLDFLPGLVQGAPALYHQGVTHSLLAGAVAAGVGAWALARAGRGGAWLFAPLLAAYLSHLAVDLVGPDGRPPYGIPLLWPASDAAFLAPWTLLPGVEHAETAGTATGAWLAAVFAPRNLAAVGAELLLLGPFAAAAALVRRRRRPAEV